MRNHRDEKGCLITFLGLVAFVIVVISIVVYFAFYSMSSLPTGEYIGEEESPNGSYTVRIYRCGGGATVDWSVRGELVNNDTGKKKNIYWQYHKQNAEVSWIDDCTVNIDDVTLDVPHDVYDYRRNPN